MEESVDIKRKNQVLLNELNAVSPDNSMHIKLSSDTKTTPIMDKYYFSDKKYLIIDRAFHVGKNWTSVSLVIMRAQDLLIGNVNGRMTMTDLKKFVGTSVGEYLLDAYKISDRRYDLIKELLIASSYINNAGDAVPFEKPVRLGGQTYANQTGYGSEYNGDDLVYQGTLYGETTGFCIIGVLSD